MKKVQQGFTLIELMIVVAIIGILAAIAIPAYQDYVTRAKWSDNVTSLASLKTAIAECLQNNAGASASCDTAAELELAALPQPPFGTAAVTIVAGGVAGDNDITVQFTGTAEVGSHVWEEESALDASGTRLIWSAGANDTVPSKFLKTGGR